MASFKYQLTHQALPSWLFFFSFYRPFPPLERQQETVTRLPTAQATTLCPRSCSYLSIVSSLHVFSHPEQFFCLPSQIPELVKNTIYFIFLSLYTLPMHYSFHRMCAIACYWWMQRHSRNNQFSKERKQSWIYKTLTKQGMNVEYWNCIYFLLSLHTSHKEFQQLTEQSTSRRVTLLH